MCANNVNEYFLPGVHCDSILHMIYKALCSGKSLTAINGLSCAKTMYLSKYISILRNEYNIPVADEWIEVGNGDKRKRIKRYFLKRV